MYRTKQFRKPVYIRTIQNNYVLVKKGKYVSERQKNRAESLAKEKADNKMNIRVGIEVMIGFFVVTPAVLWILLELIEIWL